MTGYNKVKLGFFSFTEITDPSEHHSYNEWHQLDHMPEQYPLDGVAFGQRWVSTPACRAARTASAPELDAIHYMTLYLMTEPIERTLQEFMALGRHLHKVGRFHLHRRAHMSGPFPIVEIAAAPRVLVSPEAVPYRPNLGVYVTVEPIVAPEPDLAARCAIDGVAGAWTFVDADKRVTVAWLDAPPLEVAKSWPDPAPSAVFAGPLETITPWQWDWFD